MRVERDFVSPNRLDVIITLLIDAPPLWVSILQFHFYLQVHAIQRVQNPGLRTVRAAAQDRGGGDAHRGRQRAGALHGTPSANTVLKNGFDPRFCSMKGMFGGGVYFAENSTKSCRYAGLNRRGDMGMLLLCSVALGDSCVCRVAKQQIRKPPDPDMLDTRYWMGGKFQSVFAPSSTDDSFSLLAMREYVVYHTNQAYPQYVVHVEVV